MERPFPSIRKPSAGWAGAVNYTLEDHIASPYPHPCYARKDGVLLPRDISQHMADGGAHRRHYLSTAELIFTKEEYAENIGWAETDITTPSIRESELHKYLITAPALAAILADYSASGGLGYESLVKEILGSPGSHTYKMCTATDDIKAPSIGLFVDLFDKVNAIVSVLPTQSKPSESYPTGLTSVFAAQKHSHSDYESYGISHRELWAAINAGGGGGSGSGAGSGGVIDGTLCKDSQTGNDCVTTINLFHNNQISYTYIAKHNCLLFIQLRNAIIADNESGTIPRDCILVKVGDNVVGTLTDNMQDLHNELDNDNLRLPIKAGTAVTLVGDGSHDIFDYDSLTENSYIKFSEFELTSLSMATGMPAYDQGIDITDQVTRTSLDTPTGYIANQIGYVLFRFDTTKFATGVVKNMLVVGKVADVEVYNGYYYSYGSDSAITPNLVPVRNGDTIDLITSNITGTEYEANDGFFQVIFFPMAGSSHAGNGPIEYPVLECAFTNTSSNPFIGASTPSTDDLTITTAKIEGVSGESNIDLSTCNISLKIDVFTPKRNGSTVIVDSNGFAEIDKTRPVYRNEAIVYCDADNNPAGYYNDYSRHLDVSIVGGVAKIAWTEAFRKAPALNNTVASFTLPALSSLVTANDGKALWDDFNNTYGKFIDAATDLGLSDCYIRLTAVIDPCTKIINQSVAKSGMFIDGTKLHTELVSKDIWTQNKDSDGRFTYTYIVKNDCWLYANVLIQTTANDRDIVSVLINGEELDWWNDVGPDKQTDDKVCDVSKSLSMPLKAGTVLTFRTISLNPAWEHTYNNRVVYGGTGAEAERVNAEQAAIKIIEFKMSTELTPAKFPSLAVRICDVDCFEEQNGYDVNGDAVPRALPSTSSTGAYVSWTETQLKSIFGSAFDFEHAKFDVTAVFYIGNSADDYDSATNKLEDTGIEVSLSNQGQQIRPFVVTDIVDGERVAKLSLPGISYFCSNVFYDTTDGFKLVPRDDGAHIGIGDGGNQLVVNFYDLYGKKIRMRLLLHVSDRRGEMADGGRIPNGISPNSKMVRQSDLVMISGGAPTYSNEITITESGQCILIGNIDVDSGTETGAGQPTVGVQAFIGNEWKTIAAQLTVTGGDGQGDQNFSFPVEAGLKLRVRCNYGIASGEPAGSTTNTVVPELTTRKRMVCWVIPTSKYLAPEYNLPGSAGVIDGSIWKDANGNDLVKEITPDTTTKEIIYNVKNDCYLMIALYNTDIGDGAVGDGRECIDIVVNGVVAGCLNESNQSGGGSTESGSCGINVARGSVVKLLHHHNNGTNTYALFGAVNSDNSNPKLNGLLTFTEFKLRATNVVAAMPDWDTDKEVPLSNGDIAPADGWIVFRVNDTTEMSGDYTARAKINGVEVYYWGWELSSGDNNTNTVTVPVSKGDVLTHNDTSNRMSCTFYPVKMHEIRTTSASAIEVIAMSSRSNAPSWWKVYSNGWCEQGGQTSDISSAGDKVFNLPVEMYDDKYHAQLTSHYDGSSGAAVCANYVETKTSTKLTANQGDNGSVLYYVVSGWISDATLLAIKNGTYTFFPGQS